MRKERSDKKLMQLTGEQSDQLWKWMGTPGLSYRRIVNLVKEHFDISVSTRALSEFFDERATEEAKNRMLRATRVADNLGATISKKLPEINDALKAQLTQQAFELSLAGGDVETIETIMAIVGRMNMGQLNRDKIELDVEKFQQRIREYEEKNAKAKKALEGIKSKGGLSAETIAEIEEAAGLL